MEKKLCTRCGEEKELTEFGTRPYSDGSLHPKSWCNECCSKERKKYVYTRQFTQEEVRAHNLYGNYRLTIAQWDQMWEDQNGCCLLCGLSFGDDRPHVDHDHSCCPGPRSCGECVRGLLCADCNHYIGWLEKRRYKMDRAFKYLGWDIT